MEMQSIYIYLGTIILGITVIITSLRYRLYKSRFTFYFIALMYISLITELLGMYISFNKILEEGNFIVYHIYTIFEFNLIFLMYYSLIKEKNTLSIMKIISVAFNVFYFTGCIFFTINETYTLNVIIVAVILSTFFIAYFRELLGSDQILNYSKQLPFWITTGFIIYYLPSVPFQYIRESLVDKDLTFVQPAINYLMYGCFIYGFIWTKETY